MPIVLKRCLTGWNFSDTMQVCYMVRKALFYP